MRLLASLRLPMFDRYILHQLLIALVATTGGLAALIWLTQSLRFVSLVVDRGLSLGVFLQLTGLLIPSFVAVILPITTFVVVQFIYHRLAGDREIVVMRAAGMSSFALAKPGMICALIATVACYLLNLWIVPAAYHSFRQNEFKIRNKMAAFMLQEGVFTNISNNLTVYIRSKDHNGVLKGILVEDARQPDNKATILAESGNIVIINDKPQVVLLNGSREVIDKRTGRLNVLNFKRNTIDLSSNKEQAARLKDATEMSLYELLHPNAQEVFDRDYGKLAVEAHRRLTSPLTIFSFTMVALVSVLRGSFARYGNILRPLGAIFTIVGLMSLILIIQNIATRNMIFIPFIWVVAITPGIVASFILFIPELKSKTDKPIPLSSLQKGR
ncbi:Lipopolysaccharide export LptBFGC system [Commensalibacter communis]|uniref:Permease protein LptF (LptF) n=1 Tax=Commensalibacter communis TaxID=2972786 RepID=A0A9W4XC80_9PROT|nr:LPS export ABC transporter permease LptF [Commensalibacter communis]CAI3924336.1 Lipopolysaccharide export LptBFGC system [Commensalibacter communis]CAI3925813.1 Lipopolysaccharide export LptBFGC system [Commensalibacter communis]CAI3925915.1 Lipopolysaccharide export LptBFGC system [Commensalibacter communis]CAI3926804.1 Lipopolysaccharide export LptBFGC system [Commensalibacter communis]CAI3928827.1 Lipopolysaccharide export LptBFGC system [Commensalibacter communis]